MNPTTAKTLTFALALALTGCPGMGGTACTTLAAASVSVNIVDGAGENVADATVTFTADGGPVQNCETFAAGVYICGWEVAGVIAVTAEKEGFIVATQEVTVGMTADECHVEGETLDFVLEPVDCTSVEVPGIEVSLSSLDGEALESPEVTWSIANADMAPQPCDLQGEVWSCAPEQSGDLEVWGTASGHTSGYEAVTVAMDADGCHPVTESVALVVEWGED